METGFLGDRLPLNTTLTNLTIPLESGPNASDYQLYIDGLNGRSGSLFGPSDDFSLEGSDVSSWSPVELHGALGIYDAMPCSAMQCNRSCKERWVATATRKDGWWSNQEYCECIVECPGVTTENPYYGGGDGCGWEWRIMKESMSVDSAGVVTGTITSAGNMQTGATEERSGTVTMAPAPALTRTTAAGAPSSTSAGLRLGAASVLQWSIVVVVLSLSRHAI
ncbi:hypothetical protein BCR34DRAFT_262121 [Clohesyomyces aquaticus]|uniref:Uncharacterized protein n=1 Tax=Clohesyomyces aquaticus TaxID=1231657 RepID=A0A1Y1ZTN6_9PLEO|nr:hypothetical protein BCR34DRAFT_262121 [Clohesyomyces aquaticus]